MHILNDEEIHLKFLLNLPVHVEGIGDFHAPLLDEIVNLTELKYNHSISALLLDKKNLESQEDIDQYSNYQVVSSAIYHDSSFRELFFCGLNLHFGKEPIMHEQGFIYFDELSEDSVLTEEKFDYIRKLVTIANNISPKDEEDEFIAGNDRARKFIEQQKKKKAAMAKYKKPKINLHSIISAVGWKHSFEFISRLNVYQLYDGYGRLNFIDNYHYTMQGIYSGTVDAKGIKLPDINWANIIQQK